MLSIQRRRESRGTRARMDSAGRLNRTVSDWPLQSRWMQCDTGVSCGTQTCWDWGMMATAWDRYGLWWPGLLCGSKVTLLPRAIHWCRSIEWRRSRWWMSKPKDQRWSWSTTRSLGGQRSGREGRGSKDTGRTWTERWIVLALGEGQALGSLWWTGPALNYLLGSQPDIV